VLPWVIVVALAVVVLSVLLFFVGRLESFW
jgi:hypothetical protein